MDMFQQFQTHIVEVIKDLQKEKKLPENLDLSKLTVEPPRDSSHGDIATNAALILTKQAKIPPRDLANMIVPELEKQADVEKCDVAGPGFINIKLGVSFWPKILKSILKEPEQYGQNNLGEGQKINIEYVSANPTGPMHVGHCRGAVFGDALANLMSLSGFDVTREYYMNDAGGQIDVLARSCLLRYKEALGQDIGSIPEGLYPGNYLIPVGKALAEQYGDQLLAMDENAQITKIKPIAINMMMDMIRQDLAALNIHHDVFFSEKSLHEDDGLKGIKGAIRWLKDKGLVYQGRLAPPKGKLPDDWEDREQTLFKATEYGDDVDRALVKSDGTYTYFAADIAYHKNKFDRGFHNQIDVLGADHSGYVKRLTAALKAVSEGKGNLGVKICQLVHLMRDGEPVKMSKRAGSFVTLRDVVNEVGVDPVRFMMLYRKNDASLEFDFKKVTEQNKDNPVFYVQYAHARAHSVLRKGQEFFASSQQNQLDLLNSGDNLLKDEAEIQILRRLALYPRIVKAAADHQEPHRIAFYVYDLASDFHALWNWGKVKPHLRFIEETEPKLTIMRLLLVQAVVAVLFSGLSVLGVSAPEEMFA